MKKNKTTKPSKKSYSSVKEVLEDNNSKIKLTPFNCKEAKFGKIIEIENPYSSTGKFDFIFRRASTSEKFFEGIENQRPNQILWNEEEKQAYFLNSDKQLYKMVFEPIYMKKKNKEQTTEEYMEALKKGYMRQEIKDLAIPWSKFYYKNPFAGDTLEFKHYLLEPLFIDLLAAVQQKKIKITCGVGMVALIERYFYVEPITRAFKVGSCEIVLDLDFDLPKYDIEYDDIRILGIGVPELVPQEPVKEPKDDINKALNNLNDTLDVCIDSRTTKKKSFWGRIFG